MNSWKILGSFLVWMLALGLVACGGEKKPGTGEPDSGTRVPWGNNTGDEDTGIEGDDDSGNTNPPDDDSVVPPEGDAVTPPDDDTAVPPDDDTVTPPPDTKPPENPDCVDMDGDGYGANCFLGADCDDDNKFFTVYCPPCDNQSIQGCKCTAEGTSEICYEGDPGTVGLGDCQLGLRYCQGGFWSGCVGQVVPGPEECDGKDNDCDGSTDEGVLSPCGNCDPFCDTMEVGPDSETPFDPNQDNAEGIGLNVDGYLILDSSQIDLSFIWIANSGEGTVSKLDTKSGKELGRYKVCNDPSRTAVDLVGNVWVGCRADGGVAKIAIDEAICVDKNNNGVIDTAHDKNVLPKGSDECVLFITYPGGSCARALGVDKDNNAWVGDWNGQTVKRLKSEDGTVLQSIGVGCSPYGLVIDGSGIIWISGRGCDKLLRVDPATNDVQKISPPTGNLYGITVDAKGRVWMGHYSSGGVSRYDPATGQFVWVTTNFSGKCPRGMAGSIDGWMYTGLGCGGEHHVGKIPIDDPTNVKLIDIGGGSKTTVGVALDSDGYLWAVNYSSSSATKIDVKAEVPVGEYPVGANPYTYSDMTGYALHNFTAPQGNYTTMFGGFEDFRVKWTALYIDADIPDTAYLKVEVRTAYTAEELPSTPWQGLYGPYPPELFPLDLTTVPKMDGKILQVRVWLFSKDKMSTPVVKSIQAKFATE